MAGVPVLQIASRDPPFSVIMKSNPWAEAAAMDHGVNTGFGAWSTRRAFLSGQRIALVEDDRHVIFVEFDRRTEQLAQALRGFGVRSGARVGALLMSASTVVVALNAQLLRRLDLRPGGAQ